MPKVKRSNYRAALAAALPFLKHLPYITFIFSTCLSIFIGYRLSQPDLPSQKNPFLFYSNECGDDLKLTFLRAIQGAKKSIFLIIYGLTDKETIGALNSKIAEGIDVRIFYDVHGSKRLKEKIDIANVFPLTSPGIMHKKVLIIDDKLVFLGSANLTETSLRLHDNLVIGCYSEELSYFLQQSARPYHKMNLGGKNIEVWSLPQKHKGALSRVIQELKLAKESIKISMFTFTCEKILQTLIEAKKRGIGVEVAIDYYSARGASKNAIDYLRSHHIPIIEGNQGKLLHHKWCLIDEQTLILGSTNWTNAAFSKNDDCIIFIKNLNKKDISSINNIWNKHKI